MTAASVFQLVLEYALGMAQHIPEVARAFAPFLQARVRVRLTMWVDTPGPVDPVVQVEGAGILSTTGLKLEGAPSVDFKWSGGDSPTAEGK